MAAPESSAQRRTPRVVLRVPLEVKWQGSTYSAVTAVVNRHGALILAPVSFPEGAILEVANARTGRTGRLRVVWRGDEDLPGRYKLGVEFVEERPGLWGTQYESGSDQADSAD